MGPQIISLRGGIPFLPGPLERSSTVVIQFVVSPSQKRTLKAKKRGFDPKNLIFVFLGSYAHFFMSNGHFFYSE